MKIYTHGCHISYSSQILSMYLWTIHSFHQRHCRKLLKVVRLQRCVCKVSGCMLPKVFNKMYWSCFWGPLKMLVKFFIQSYKYIMHVDKRWSSSSHDSWHNNGHNYAWESEISQLVRLYSMCFDVCLHLEKTDNRLVVLFWDRIFYSEK